MGDKRKDQKTTVVNNINVTVSPQITQQPNASASASARATVKSEQRDHLGRTEQEAMDDAWYWMNTCD